MTILSAIHAMPTSALLALLVGETAAHQLAGRPLAEVFSLYAEPPLLKETCMAPEAERILEASKELLARALQESMQSRSLLDTPDAVRDYLKLRLADRDHEVFYGLFLDAQNRLIADVELFRGTLSQTSVYPREIVKAALGYNAAGVIFAHNHPSGVAEPSQADVHLTRTLKQALALVDVRTVDHFIVAGAVQTLSMAERGFL